MEIGAIDLNKSMRGKDFGKGFYLSADISQAKDMAVFKAMQYGGEPIVTAFEFDDKELQSETIRFKCFEEYSLEWAEFVFANRNNQDDLSVHSYDIVYGPIADDKVGVQIRNLIEQNITIEVFLERLKYIKGITFQYYFGTQKAIKLLKHL